MCNVLISNQLPIDVHVVERTPNFITLYNSVLIWEYSWSCLTMEESSKLCTSPGNRPYGSLHPLKSDCGIRRSLKVRRIGSKGAVLVIIWSLLVFSMAVTLIQHGYIIFNILNNSFLGGVSFAAIPAVVLVGPIAGLLASTYFGRYKTLYTGPPRCARIMEELYYKVLKRLCFPYF